MHLIWFVYSCELYAIGLAVYLILFFGIMFSIKEETERLRIKT